MALVHKTSATYSRFVFDPEDIGQPYWTANGERIDLTDDEALSKAIKAKKDLGMSREIREGAVKINVTYRVLGAGAIAQMTDELSRLSADAESDAREGTQRLLAVRYAIVDWDAEGLPWSEVVLEELDADLFDQLYVWVSKKGHPPEQNQEDGLPLASQPVEFVASSSTLGKKPMDRQRPQGRSSSRSKSSTQTSRAAGRSPRKPSGSGTEA